MQEVRRESQVLKHCFLQHVLSLHSKIQDTLKALSFRMFPLVIYASFLIFVTNLDGSAGSENATGDSQKKLDVLSNEMMVCRLVPVESLSFIAITMYTILTISS